MRLEVASLLCLFFSTSFASAAPLAASDFHFDANGQPTYQVHGSDFATAKPAARVPGELNGTWDGAIIYNDGTAYEFLMEMAEFPAIDAGYPYFPASLAVRLTVAGQTRFTGTFAFDDTLFVYVVAQDNHGYFSALARQPDGKFTGTSKDQNDKTVQVILKPKSTDQPFYFTKVVMSGSMAPRLIDDVLYFGSPQAAISKTNVARVDGQSTILLDYNVFHDVKGIGGSGVGGLIDLAMAVAAPETFAAVIRTTLDHTAAPKLTFDWAKSGKMVSAAPLVFRFDNDDEQIHVTVSEPEN